MKNELLESALFYASKGFRVFPLAPRSKTPLKDSKGFKDATTEENKIREWWSKHPNANIGIATGNGFSVIDIDFRNNGQAHEQAILDKIIKVKTPMVHTGNGRHYYCLTEDAQPSTVLAQGVDVKSNGGYVVAPPSIHPSGAKYTWDEDLMFGFVECATVKINGQLSDDPLPVKKKKKTILIKRGEIIEAGSRNDSLASRAGYYRKRGLDGAELVAALKAYNLEHCAPPLQDREVESIAKSINKYPSGEEWPEILPLLDRTEPARFPVDALPSPMREAVEEVSQFVQAPDALVAATALTVAAAAVQGRFDVARDEKLIGSTGIFILTIGVSGERKTACENYFLKPLIDHQIKEKERLEPVLKNYQSLEDSWKAKRTAILGDISRLTSKGDEISVRSREDDLKYHDLERPKPPRVPRVIYHDATTEALLAGISKWPSGVMVSSEAGGVFGSHGMNKDNIMRYLSALNRLWDGHVDAVDRRQAGNIEACTARFSAGLMAQSETLHDFMASSRKLARGSGFLARFLLSEPKSNIGTRNYRRPTEWVHQPAFCKRILEILDDPIRFDESDRIDPKALTMTVGAYQVWEDYHNEIELEIGLGGRFYHVQDAGSKSAEQAARLAAIFEVIDGGAEQISPLAMTRGVAVARYYLDETARLFGDMSVSPAIELASRLLAWMIDRVKETGDLTMTKRTIMQFISIRELRKNDVLTSCVATVAQHGYIREKEDGRRKIIEMNPLALEKNHV